MTFDPDLVRRAAQRLTAGIEAPNATLADKRLDRITQWGARSPRNTNVLFAAVQMLRDLGTIDRAEAAYLFNGLRGQLEWNETTSERGPDPDLTRALQDGVDHDLIMAAMHDQERARTVAWYRDRGEEDLAELVRDNIEEYEHLCATGQISLLDDKPAREERTPRVEDPAASARMAERVLALSGTETFREWHQAWSALCEVMNDIDPAIAVPAIRNVRDIGGVSFDESLVLIDMAIAEEVHDVFAADRLYYLLEREVEAFEELHGSTSEDPIPDEARPLAWQILHREWSRRMDGLTAGVLRRYGEHRLANLLIANPEEYGRILAEFRIGATGND